MNKRFLLIVLGLFTCALVTACGASTDQPGTTPTIPSSPSPGVSPSITPVPLATLMPAPTFTPTAIPTDTPVPTPTASPTSPVVWYVQAVELPDVLDDYHPIWLDNETLVMGTWERMHYRIPASSGELPALLPTPTPFHNLDDAKLRYSPTGAYVVEISETYLALYRVDGAELLAKTELALPPGCCWIRWNDAESAFSFVIENDTGDSKVYTTDIYIWRTDGSQPYKIGMGSFLEDPGSWSPDSQRLAVEIYGLFDSESPEDEYRYDILFVDGRQQVPVRAQLSSRSQPGVDWLTNDIVYEDNVFSATCLATTYYAVFTGEEIPEMAYWNCYTNGNYNNQKSLLSPDQRWFVVDVTEDAFFESEDQVDYTYHLFDIYEDKTYTLGSSGSDYLDFIGWSFDSSRFYFLRRPYDPEGVEQSGETYGFIAYDTATHEFIPLNPDLLYAWLSPDHQKLLGIIGFEDGFFAGLFSLNGQPFSEFTRVELDPSWQPSYDPGGDRSDINVSWASDSSQVAFTDFSGSLWWIKKNGDTYLLAERLPQEVLTKTGFLWSPDNTRLVVMAETAFAWVIFMYP